MAKPQKKKQRPSWFQKQVERDGENFLLKRQPLDIQREAFNIVRDIARGNITPRDFKYLFNLTLLSNIRIAVYKKYVEYHTYNASMSLNIQNGNINVLQNNFGIDGVNFNNIYNNNKELLTCYTLVLQGIDAMIYAIQVGYPNEEVKQQQYLSVYSSVQYQISRFKYII